MSLQLYIGDALTILPIVQTKVQLVVTSIPYWNLKDYAHPDQIGFGQSYPEYLGSVSSVLRLSYDVLSPGCKMAINIGDMFVRGEKGQPYHLKPLHAEVIRMCTGFGCSYLGGIIWRKITNTASSGGCSLMGSMYYPRDGVITYEHEFILLFKKPGKAPKVSEEARSRSQLTLEERSSWFRGYWDFPPEKKSAHPAPFPIELPRRLIRMFTYYGETVLDPFAGGGTTIAAAAQTGRSAIGIELNAEYAALCKVPGLEVLNV